MGKKTMRVLVTGGLGFIGSHLVDRLIDAGHKVFVIDDISGGRFRNKNDKAVAIYLHDLRKIRRTEQIIERIKPEVVFHLACDAAENKAQFSPIDVTTRVWNAFINTLTSFIRHKGKRFVFASSIAVYGALQVPFKETDKPEPEDLYGITKLACEQTLAVMSKVHGFEYVIARPHNVYGPRQNMRDPYRNVVTIWMNRLLKKEPIYIYGDGEQRRCFSYIDEVVDAIYKCGFEDVSGMTFNIGSDRHSSLNDLARAITTEKPNYLPERLQEVKVAIADHTFSRKHLGYKETPLEEGIKKTWAWVKKQGPQELEYTQIELPTESMPMPWKRKN